MRPSLLLVLVAVGCAAPRAQTAPASPTACAPEEPTVTVIVAAEAIPAGTTLELAHVARRSVPRRFVTSSMVIAADGQQAVGRRTSIALEPGDFVTWPALAPVVPPKPAALGVPPGMRAVTIPIEALVNGQLFPGDHVDVVGNFRDPASGQSQSTVIAQNVVVLDQDPRSRLVSLVVSPKQGEALRLAADLGILALLIRNRDDATVVDNPAPTGQDTLIRSVQPVAPAATPAAAPPPSKKAK